MYRLLLVDDEDFIANSLAFMLESSQQFELDVYKAYTAFQALDYLNRIAFDIVVTDIQMPGMSGIKLAENIHRRWPNCKIIFLTCFDEFEYAYKAVQYRAVRYVLKNEGDEAILSAISECIDLLEREANSSELLAKAEEQLREYMPIMRQSLLQSYLLGNNSYTEWTASEFKRLDIGLDPALPVMLLAARVTPDTNGDVIVGIDLAIGEKMGHVVKSQIAWTDSNSIVWIVQPRDEGNYEQVKVTIKGVAENVQRVCAGTLNVQISFILDSALISWEKLADHFTVLKYTVKHRLAKYPDIAMAGIEFFMGEINEGGCNKSSFIQYKELLEKLSVCMMLGDLEGIEDYSRSLSLILTKFDASALSGLHALEINTELNRILLSYINKHGLQDMLKDDEMFRLFITDTETGINYRRIEQFAALGKRVIGLAMQEQAKTNDMFVSHLLNYIQNNIDADLSLYALSEKVYLNPSYLSRRFKEITGKNITETIIEMRMAAACRLLKETTYKINKIASMVGYDSAAYFSRLFKRQIGTTPQKYRDA